MIYFQSESCITIDLSQVHSEKTIWDLKSFLTSKNIKGWMEAVPTYDSLSIYFDVQQVNVTDEELLNSIKYWINEFKSAPIENNDQERVIVEIPVCYEGVHALDLAWALEYTGLTKDDFIHQHTTPVYQVKMLGFIPGFPYLGFVPDEIQLPRLVQARPKVLAGSVGIAAAQTGIYPIDISGGWKIIGRTPFLIFDKKMKEPFLLSPMDWVKFYPISTSEFDQMNQHSS